MSKEERNLSPSIHTFKSPSTGQLCTPSQYIAEIMCIRYAEKENIGNLAYKFWNKKQKEAYVAQIVCANKLIDEFGQDKVIGWILDNPRIYSLGKYQPVKFIKEAIFKYVPKAKPAPSKEIEEVKISKSIRPAAPKKKNLLEQLNRIDNGKDKET